MPFDHRFARALILGLFVGALSSGSFADTFTWDGSVDRRWGSLVFDFPTFDTNWDQPTPPGSDDIARFDGTAPGEVIVGGVFGIRESIAGLIFDSPSSSYQLVKDSVFGGELRLGTEGVTVRRGAGHTIEADLVLPSGWTTVDVVRSDAILELQGKLAADDETAVLYKQGDGLLRLKGLDPGSALNTLQATAGRTVIDGGELSLETLTLGEGNSDSVSTLDVTGSPSLTIGSIHLERGSSNNFIDFMGSGTSLATTLRDTRYANYRLEVEGGAEVHLMGSKVFADRDDEIVVRRGRLAVEAIDMTARPGSKPIRLEDPAGGGAALVIGGSASESWIDADIVDVEFGRGSLRKVGPGRLTLNGRNTLSGSVIVESGELVIGRDGSFGDGAPIELAEPATLVAHNDALRGMEGPGRVLALDDVLLGDFTSRRGFHVGGIIAGPNDVVLLDADEATLTAGVSTVAGGRLRTTAGLRIEADAALEGYGDIEGPVRNLGRIEGSNLGRSDLGPQTLTLNAAATGSGDFLGNIIFNDTFDPGDSTARVTVGSPEFRSRVVMEIAGLDHFDQIHVLGAAQLGGELEIKLLDGFEPVFGNHFDLLQATTAQASLEGSFDNVLLPVLDAGLAWQIEQTDFRLTVAVVPEPGSGLLLTLAAPLITRRPARRHQSSG